uniref:Class A beta-lactamase-related serine hydrolase n=1 Tax=Eiseniibacteriota bacterium TaxID=2212470 RepID=A0A832MNC4_UNCEI
MAAGIRSLAPRGALAALGLVAALVSGPAPRAASASDPPAALEIPETPPGRRVRDYFAAFARDEAAMRAYFEANVSADDLARRPLADRLEVWREMRAEHGRLAARRVAGTGPDFIEIEAENAHGVRLAMRFLFSPEPPHTLRGIRVEDLAGAGPPPAPAGPPPSDEAIVEALGAELDSLSAADAFSGVALLDRDGKTIYARAFGLASREERRPNTLETRFNLGSINKIFTHVAVLQLAAEGRLRLDDTVDRWLPDYPGEAGAKITLRMLLDHRGGVPDVFASPYFRDGGDPGRLRTHADWYALVRAMPLDFEPGTRQAYSNGGFVLLGEVVARASGRDYHDVVRERIYRPAGMTRSDSYARDARVPDRARPYTRGAEHGGGAAPGGPSWRDATPGLPGRGSAAGGGYATAGDLVRFARALRSGALVRGPDAARFVGPQGALGIAGGSPGVNALLISEGPYTLVVLANQDPPAAERFARTAGAMVRRAAAAAAGSGGPTGARR